MAEWSKAHAWKVCRRVTVSRVRIPFSPPLVPVGRAPIPGRPSMPFHVQARRGGRPTGLRRGYGRSTRTSGRPGALSRTVVCSPGRTNTIRRPSKVLRCRRRIRCVVAQVPVLEAEQLAALCCRRNDRLAMGNLAVLVAQRALDLDDAVRDKARIGAQAQRICGRLPHRRVDAHRLRPSARARLVRQPCRRGASPAAAALGAGTLPRPSSRSPRHGLAGSPHCHRLARGHHC